MIFLEYFNLIQLEDKYNLIANYRIDFLMIKTNVENLSVTQLKYQN